MLKELRTRQKLRQKDVAEYLGIHVMAYQKYEYNSRKLPVHHAIKLKELYGCTLDFIYGVGM